MIEKNSTIPTKKTQTFTTAVDNQPVVSIIIFQGNSKLTKYNKRLGKLDLSGISPAPRGVPQIEITYELDANGCLKISAMDKASSKQEELFITNDSTAYSQEEIDRLKKEAEDNEKSAEEEYE